MRILLINASDTKGGAAQVGWNLMEGLRERGHEVEMWAGKKSSDSPWVKQLPMGLPISKRSIKSRVLHRLGVTLDLQSNVPRQLDESALRRFDLMHLHDLPSWNWSHFSWLMARVPIVWTIHSMAPFTGNCLYSFGCDRFQHACGRCPQHGQWPLLWNHRDGSRLNLILKRILIGRLPLRLIGVSDWISEQCRRSSLFRKVPVVTIRNAVNPKRFYPVGRKVARDRLGIPQNAKAVLLSVSGNPLDLRKGLDVAIGALEHLADFPLFLMPLGISGELPALKESFQRFPGLAPRHVADDSTLRDYYAAADVVWHPSRADTSSMVSLEAFACGTPVIAAAVGGVPEVVGETRGILIPPESPVALADATRQFFGPDNNTERLRHQAQRHSAAEGFDRMLDEHESLYQKVSRHCTAPFTGSQT